MNDLMRQFNHIHVWWLGSCSSSGWLTCCCRCTCALSLASCLRLIPYIDSDILLLARTAWSCILGWHINPYCLWLILIGTSPRVKCNIDSLLVLWIRLCLSLILGVHLRLIGLRLWIFRWIMHCSCCLCYGCLDVPLRQVVHIQSKLLEQLCRIECHLLLLLLLIEIVWHVWLCELVRLVLKISKYLIHWVHQILWLVLVARVVWISTWCRLWLLSSVWGLLDILWLHILDQIKDLSVLRD